MIKRILPLLLILIMAVSVGAVSANLTSYNGYDHSKSIGIAGIQNWSVGQKGMCVDLYHHIKGELHHVYVGTPKTSTMNKVKLLIVTYYKNSMNKRQGANLQYAVWYFTNNKKSPNKTVTGMINKIKNSNTIVSDRYIKGNTLYTFNSIRDKNSQKIVLFNLKIIKPTPKPPICPTKNNTIIIYVNNTVYVNNIVYVNNTINCTKPKPCIPCKPVKPCKPVIKPPCKPHVCIKLERCKC
jgi:hypothetical protein